MKRTSIFVAFHLLLGWMVSPSVCAQETLANRLREHLYFLADDSLGGRKAGTHFGQRAAEYIAQQFKEIGMTPLYGDSYFKSFQDMFRNVVGIIEGNHSLLKDEYIVIGAHYDHLGRITGKKDITIYNGADDNASGTAVVIELARILMERRANLDRSVIIIAFDAEEEGLIGSYNFVNYAPVPLDKIKLMFSIDMVGWYQASGYVKYLGSGTFRNGKEIITDNRITPLGLNVEVQSFERMVLGSTDTFGFAEKGIPTLAVTTGLKSPYHKPHDTADLIDYHGMALITEHLSNVVQAISTNEHFASSGKISPKHKAPLFSLGVCVNYGVNKHYYTAGAVDGKTAGAYSVGLTASWNMGAFGLRPEVYYDYIHARHPQGKVITHGVTTPLNFILQTKPSFSGGFAIFAGPYYHHNFGGKQGKTKLDFDHLFRRDEMGMNWGVELRLASIRLGYTRRDAFTNFTRTQNEDGAHIRNRANFITLGYQF